MDPELCDIIAGSYLGGARCDRADPCERFRLPPGFELVDVNYAMIQHDVPGLNDCGEIVAAIVLGSTAYRYEVFLDDNGRLVQLTSDNIADAQPSLNDLGQLAWRISSIGLGQLVFWSGTPTVLVESHDATAGPRVNNRGHFTWYQYGPASCPLRSGVHFHDGVSNSVILDDGLSSQLLLKLTDFTPPGVFPGGG
jgi:hypothetical protein